MQKMIKLKDLNGQAAYIDIDSIRAIVDLKEVPPGPLYPGGPYHNGHPRRTRVDYGRDNSILVTANADEIYNEMEYIAGEDKPEGDVFDRIEEAMKIKWLENENGGVYSPELKLAIEVDGEDYYCIRKCDEAGRVEEGVDAIGWTTTLAQAQIDAFKLAKKQPAGPCADGVHLHDFRKVKCRCGLQVRDPLWSSQ